MCCLAFILVAQVTAQPCFSLTWKDGKRAALSISYDDGFASQRSAASVLKTAGFRGTFYLAPTAGPDVIPHTQEWRQISEEGHEIGNHSMRHPCNDNNLPERRNLRLMTWQQVADEVNDGEGWIVKYIFNGELKDHTYAYPCSI